MIADLFGKRGRIMNHRQKKKAFKKKYGVNPKDFWKESIDFSPRELGQQINKSINAFADMLTEYSRSLHKHKKESEETE